MYYINIYIVLKQDKHNIRKLSESTKKITIKQDRKAHLKHQKLAYLPVSKARTKLNIYFPTICVLLLLPTLCLVYYLKF